MSMLESVLLLFTSATQCRAGDITKCCDDDQPLPYMTYETSNFDSLAALASRMYTVRSPSGTKRVQSCRHRRRRR
ncbi:hypothetical protein BDR22DRAFT_836045 [Usnea florida]